MKTLALLDGLQGGHHLTYMRLYSRAALELGLRVLCLFPDPDQVRGWLSSRVSAEALDRFQGSPFRDTPIVSPFWRVRDWYVPFVRWRRAARALRAAARAHHAKVDFVIFQWLDDYLIGGYPALRVCLPWIFPNCWSGLFFQPWHLRLDVGGKEWMATSEQTLRAHNCVGPAVLDHGIADRLARHIGKSVFRFPDASDTELPPRSPAGVERLRAAAAGRRVVGLFGSLAKRKGVIPFLDLAERCENEPFLFVLAGEFDAGVQGTFNAEELNRLNRLLKGPSPNLLFLPGRIDDEREFNALIAACDVVYAVYDQYAHSSGLVTKAAHFQKPVLVADGLFMAETVRAHELGVVVEFGDVPATHAGLIALLAPMAGRRPEAVEACTRFMQATSTKALQRALAELLRHAGVL